MKICKWLFNTDKINFDNYDHSNIVTLRSFGIIGYSVCVINWSYSCMETLWLKGALGMYMYTVLR